MIFITCWAQLLSFFALCPLGYVSSFLNVQIFLDDTQWVVMRYTVYSPDFVGDGMEIAIEAKKQI